MAPSKRAKKVELLLPNSNLGIAELDLDFEDINECETECQDLGRLN